jgi:hypothetical protein
MPSVFRYAGQVLFYAAVVGGIGYFSSSPAYQDAPDGMAQIKLSFRHGGQRVEDCRKLTPEEIQKLPPNERRPNTCSRQRVPIVVELKLDGKLLYAAVLPPSGLSGDGPSQTYAKFLVPAGRHAFEARLRDSKREAGYDYETVTGIDLAPYQSLAVDFEADRGGFLLR